MNLGSGEEEHTVHQENHERNEAQDEIVGSFRCQGSHIIIIKPLNQPFDKKQAAAVRAFRFHDAPPFHFLYYTLSAKWLWKDDFT